MSLKNILETYRKGLKYDALEGVLRESVARHNKIAFAMAGLDEELTDLKIENLLLNEQLIEEPEAKKPIWLYGVLPYVPQRRFVSKHKDLQIKFDDPRDVFDKSAYLYRLMNGKGWLDGEKSLRQANKVHSWIVTQINYEFDDFDNYRPITETLLAGMGDCEDSSMVLASAYGLAGWKEDEVFLAVGWYDDRFYHAWCNVKIDGKWYVSEGTDPSKKLQPWSSEDVKSRYKIDGLWNWKFKGKMKGRQDLDV